MAVALPHERRVGPAMLVAMPERLGELEGICPSGDHQRRERVPQIAKVKPLEVGAPRAFGLAAARLTALENSSARKLSEFHTLSERGDGKTSPCALGRRARSCSRNALRARAQR